MIQHRVVIEQLYKLPATVSPHSIHLFQVAGSESNSNAGFEKTMVSMNAFSLITSDRYYLADRETFKQILA